VRTRRFHLGLPGDCGLSGLPGHLSYRGDLAPMSQVALLMMGEGEAFYQVQVARCAKAAGLRPEAVAAAQAALAIDPTSEIAVSILTQLQSREAAASN